MQSQIEFRRLSWEALVEFLRAEESKPNQDVDTDVRYVPYQLYAEQTVEGLYLDGELVGFARWAEENRHLSNLYVAPEARGRGVARQYLRERRFGSLFVMPHNEGAKRLYESMGFVKRPCGIPTREYMVRDLLKTQQAA